jgi:hypothetical protein
MRVSAKDRNPPISAVRSIGRQRQLWGKTQPIDPRQAGACPKTVAWSSRSAGQPAEPRMPLHFRDGDIHYLARMTLDLTDEEADALTPPSPRCDRLRPIPVRAAARSAQGDPHKARSAGAAAETSASAAAGRGAGLAACQKDLSVGFITAAAVVHELIEARDEKRLLRLQRQIAGYKLLIIDELGYVPLSTTGAELLFEIFSQRYERGSTLVTSNLPFDEWTGVFGSERLTGALLDRLTHHVHILEMNGDSYRLKQSKQRQRQT